MNTQFTLKPGDVANYEGEDYVVTSQTTYRAPRATWREWMLELGSGDRWLILVLADRELLMGDVCTPEGVPGDGVLRLAGRSLDLALAGKADVETVNDVGATGFDRVDYWHYADNTGARVFITRGHGGDRALLLGPTDPIGFEVYGG